MDALLNLARWIERSRVNGPGERFVVWTQGCGFRCDGCWNPDTWAMRPRVQMPPHQLSAAILATQGIEGITLTGGEPFLQAEGLLSVAHAARRAGLSVMAFTGFELAALATGPRRQLRDACDVIVAGRYVAEERDLGLIWRGSHNQRVHFITDRYGTRDLEAARGLDMEIHIDASGQMSLTGFPVDWSA